MQPDHKNATFENVHEYELEVCAGGGESCIAVSKNETFSERNFIGSKHQIKFQIINLRKNEKQELFVKLRS